MYFLIRYSFIVCTDFQLSKNDLHIFTRYLIISAALLKFVTGDLHNKGAGTLITAGWRQNAIFHRTFHTFHIFHRALEEISISYFSQLLSHYQGLHVMRQMESQQNIICYPTHVKGVRDRFKNHFGGGGPEDNPNNLIS